MWEAARKRTKLRTRTKPAVLEENGSDLGAKQHSHWLKLAYSLFRSLFLSHAHTHIHAQIHTHTQLFIRSSIVLVVYSLRHFSAYLELRCKR